MPQPEPNTTGLADAAERRHDHAAGQRAHIAMLSSSCPSQRTISCQSARACSAAPWRTSPRLAALHRRAQHSKLLILRDAPLTGRDRPITSTNRDHANLVRASLRPDLGPPLLRIHAVQRADLTTPQQLRIIATRTLEVLLRDPPKPLVVLRLHALPR